MEKAAMAAEQEHMVSSTWVAVLGALLLACVAAMGWLLWRRADDRRRQEEAFFTMAADDRSPVAIRHDEPPSPVAPVPVFQAPASAAGDAAVRPEHGTAGAAIKFRPRQGNYPWARPGTGAAVA